MSRPKKNGAVKVLSDMSPEDRWISCVFGKNSIYKTEAWWSAYRMVIAGSIIRDYLSEVKYSIKVSLTIVNDNHHDKTVIEKPLLQAIHSQLEALINPILEQGINAIKTKDANYFHEFANMMDELIQREGVNDPLRLCLLNSRSNIKDLTIKEICQLIPKSLANDYRDKPEFARHIRKLCKELDIPIQKDRRGRPPLSK